MTVADALRPYLWLAAFAFIVGFVSYIALGRPAVAEERVGWSPATSEQVSAPVSDEWNIPKRI